MRHTSPYTRSHEPDPGSIIKLKKVSQKPIDEELYEVKGDLISSLTEQSIHLKRDLDVKERVLYYQLFSVKLICQGKHPAQENKCNKNFIHGGPHSIS